MIIKDILKAACTYLDDLAALNYLNGSDNSPSSATLSRINSLVALAGLVVSELASTYIPMKYKEETAVENGRITFSDLTYNVTRIVSVKDFLGKVEYEFFPTYIAVKTGAPSCTVEYEYAPSNYGLTDSVGFSAEVTATLLSYGLCAEFCVKEGRFEEAMMWRKRYSEGVERLCLPKNSKLAGRCWL